MKGSPQDSGFFFYGIDGRMLGKYAFNQATDNVYCMCVYWKPSTLSKNLYFNGQLIATDNLRVATDRLGSVRANGPGETFHYYPYGEEYTTTVQNRVKYGTYYRDLTTALELRGPAVLPEHQ